MANTELLTLASRLLAWDGDAKRLEESAASEKEGELRGKLRSKFGRLLENITDEKTRCRMI